MSPAFSLCASIVSDLDCPIYLVPAAHLCVCKNASCKIRLAYCMNIHTQQDVSLFKGSDCCFWKKEKKNPIKPVLKLYSCLNNVIRQQWLILSFAVVLFLVTVQSQSQFGKSSGNIWGLVSNPVLKSSLFSGYFYFSVYLQKERELLNICVDVSVFLCVYMAVEANTQWDFGTMGLVLFLYPKSIFVPLNAIN